MLEWGWILRSPPEGNRPRRKGWRSEQLPAFYMERQNAWEKEKAGRKKVRASGCSGMNFKAQYATGRGKHSFVSSRLGRVG